MFVDPFLLDLFLLLVRCGSICIIVFFGGLRTGSKLLLASCVTRISGLTEASLLSRTTTKDYLCFAFLILAKMR